MKAGRDALFKLWMELISWVMVGSYLYPLTTVYITLLHAKRAQLEENCSTTVDAVEC